MAKKTTTIRGVKSSDDRNAGRGGYITLKKTGESFVGYALFIPLPPDDLKKKENAGIAEALAKAGASENPGYYEYWEHYTPATGYVPCTGEGCFLCEEGDNPNTRAKALWLVVSDEDDDPSEGELKTFNLNYSTIMEFVDYVKEGETVFGKMFRIKRQDDRGRYTIRPKSASLKPTAIKASLKNSPDYEQQLVSTLNRVLEEQEVSSALV